jgi:PAS domain S-box-containing protein
VRADTISAPLPAKRRLLRPFRFGRGARERPPEAEGALTEVSPHRPPRLVSRFGLYAGLALVCAAAGGTWLARHQATARAERDVWADAKFTADRLGRDDLSRIALARPVRDPGTVGQLDELFGRVALSRGVVRVTLFSRAGQVTYSTDHSLIGTMPYDLDKVRQAMTGQVVHGLSQLRGGFGANPMVLHSYVPVYWYFDKNSSPNGVIGVYRDYAPVASAIHQDTLLQAGAITAALLILYLLSFPILKSLMRTLQEDNRLLVKQADALRESEEQYRLIVETAAEGVSLLDAEGQIVFANRNLAEMLARPVEELTGRPLVSFMDEHSRAVADHGWFRSHRSRELREFTLLRSDGDAIYTTMSANPVFDHDGAYTGALAMVTDVSDRKRSEQALQTMEQQLRDSPGAAASKQAASIAHDFSNAVTAISGYSEFLLNRLDSSDPLHREAVEIRKAAEEAVGLTRRLLAFSRRESLRAQLLDVGAVVREVEPTLPDLVGDEVHIATRVDPELWNIRADPTQIKQMLVHLAIHAGESMPDGGRLTIEVGNAELDEDYAREHSPLTAGQYVQLAVSDTGNALDEPAEESVSDPSLADSGSGEGVGRGLATVHGIVKETGGTVWTEGDPAGGSTVTVYLPRAQTDG